MKPHEKFVGEPDCKHSFPRKTRESPGPVEQRQPLLRALDRQRSDQVIRAGAMSENGSLGIEYSTSRASSSRLSPANPLSLSIFRAASRNRRSRSRTSFCLRVSVLRGG